MEAPAGLPTSPFTEHRLASVIPVAANSAKLPDVPKSTTLGLAKPVGVTLPVTVAVTVGVTVPVMVVVTVGVTVAVAVEPAPPVEVAVGVEEGVAVKVFVAVAVTVRVAVGLPTVGVLVGVAEMTGVKVDVDVALAVAVTVRVAVGLPTVGVLVGVAEMTGVRVTVKVPLPGMIGAAGLVLSLQLTAVKKMKGTIKKSAKIFAAAKTLFFFTINPFAA